MNVFKLDHGSNRLMALLYRNLERAGVRAPEHEVLKGNWRYHWYQNKSRLREFSKLQAMLAATGIPVVAMKGIPLAAFYYEDIGVRPMADVDLLVRRSDAKAAVECLLSYGYLLTLPFKEEQVATKGGRTFFKEGATEVDLHWSVLHDFNVAWSDEALWAGTQTRTFDGMTVRFLRIEDQILHLCSHGMRYDVVSPLRWLADVAMVLRREGHRLDMDYLLGEAGRREMVNPVKRTFAWLEKHLDLPCAPLLRRGLQQMRPSWSERLDYFWRAYPVKGLPGLVPLWVEHWRVKVALGEERRHRGFLSFYARRNKLNGKRAAAAHITLMLVKWVMPWLMRRAMDWIREFQNELFRETWDVTRGPAVVV
ncbi:MAG TPA: nucleotidyltransferase family protein [Rariglobus sp.]|nr:nucleotidyltransferase family protein [Rariglobus sp.]